jgi:hypothetical protein
MSALNMDKVEHRRFEEFSERQIHRVGLWAPVLSTSFE